MASPYKKTFPITWDQLHRDAKLLAARLLEKGCFDRIIAVTRGGLVPAAIIARELKIYNVDTVCIQTHEKGQETEEVIIKGLESDESSLLVIDDLADSGRTAKAIRAMFPNATFVTLYAKPVGALHVDMFITEVSQETWILLPWSSEMQYAKPIAE